MKKILSTTLLYMLYAVDFLTGPFFKFGSALHSAMKEPQMIIDKPTPTVNPAGLRGCVDTHPTAVADIEIAKAKKQARGLAGYGEKTDGEKIRDIYKDKFLK